MDKLISVITRDGNGPLRIVQDRTQPLHADYHAGLDAALAERQAVGDDMVLILAADDSVLRHWTRPAHTPGGGADVAAQVAAHDPADRPRAGRAGNVGGRRHARKKKAKKR